MAKEKKKHHGPPAILQTASDHDWPFMPLGLVQNLGLWSLLGTDFGAPRRSSFEIHNAGGIQRWLLLYLPGLHASALSPDQSAVLDKTFAYTKPVRGARSVSVQDEMGRLPESRKDRKANKVKKQEERASTGEQAEELELKHSLESIRATPETLAASGYPQTGVKLDLLEGSNEGYAIDCEMCLCGTESVLTRIAVVRFSDRELLIDELVKPSVAITDYLTPFSGITPEMLQDVAFSLADAQAWLRNNIGRTDTLIGHSLDNDLKVLQVQHPYVADTALLFPHYRGLPYRSSLKYLAKVFLDWDIQRSAASGHNPVEDAIACERLVKLILHHGPEFGDEKLHRVAITSLLKQHGRNSTVIGPGVPTWDAFGSGNHISESSISKCVDTALKACEKSELVCCTLDGSETPQAVIDELPRLIDGMPKQTLVTAVVPADPAHTVEMRRLERKQRQYRYEYRTKKWDEIEDPWTMEDDNALQKAANLARTGRLYATITVDEERLAELPHRVRARALFPPISAASNPELRESIPDKESARHEHEERHSELHAQEPPTKKRARVSTVGSTVD